MSTIKEAQTHFTTTFFWSLTYLYKQAKVNITSNTQIKHIPPIGRSHIFGSTLGRDRWSFPRTGIRQTSRIVSLLSLWETWTGPGNPTLAVSCRWGWASLRRCSGPRIFLVLFCITWRLGAPCMWYFFAMVVGAYARLLQCGRPSCQAVSRSVNFDLGQGRWRWRSIEWYMIYTRFVK